MWLKMKVNKFSVVMIMSSLLLYFSLALDECKDTNNTNCQSCGNSDYPRDEFYRDNCMKSCNVCTGTNIALGKPTGQSSTYETAISSKAVDGNTSGNFSKSSCTHTNSTGNEWWCVDLQQIYNIDNIKLFNRDSYKNRLRGFEIKISSSGQCNETGFTSATSCYKDTSSTPQDIYTIERCNQPSFTSTSISARTIYVTVSSQPLTLCEVQIFSAAPTNVALRQHSVQQSTTNHGYIASRAVDGDTNSDIDIGLTCTHTIEGRSGWWCVDLQQLYYFNQIKIYNIQDKRWWWRLRGFEIKTSSSGQCSGQGLQLATSCYKDTTSTIQSVYNVTGCNQPSSTSFSGRIVYVKSFNDALVMCEVEIFADLAQCNTGYYSTSRSTCQPCDRSNGVCTGDCKTGFYGTRCQQNCNDGCLNNQCDRNGRCTNCITHGRYGDRCDKNCSTGCDDGCDRGTGRCTSCIKGKAGDVCDIDCNTDCAACDRGNVNACIECKDGRWGPSCNKLCNPNCKSVAGTTIGKCDQMTGNCIDGCSPGKMGSNCTTDCEAGTYGDNCEIKCGNCVDERPCDVITGSCGLAGCAEGYQGPTCHESLPISTSTAISPVVYVVIGVLCGILGTVAVFLAYRFYKKRSQSNRPKEDTVPDYVYSNTDLNPTTSTTDDTLTTGYQNIPTNTRNVDYVNQSFNTEDNTTNMYDTLDHTAADTNNTYTSIDSNKTKQM